ncbi:hypothetical protein EV189_2356 [Motilibacter rhizosphaerae]|uniref:Uncharacterized protein n=1 Tax=Motilibacter rhizosphaerae TaxID=598652 RepID=A0A4Q7NPH4_9ACTN|nr:hypothetical protein [Motilibacter rhizosphaerae]RZS86938.1 hypothetical protein EV189_2356 [Motilibacter rhizosphaerae]
MADGYNIDTTVVAGVAGDLSTTSGTLSGQVGALAVTPDAGSSSGEVAGAFAALSSALRGLAETVQGLSVGVSDAVSTYTGSDSGAARSFSGPGATP